jgi:murein DD-endopeptidase MepM/ murein hydrolase activator NlpD
MQIIIIPKRSGRACRSCLSSRTTWVLGIFLFLILPVTAGGVSWYLANQWSATDIDQSSAELIAEQKQRLSILQKHVNKIQRQSEASLDALSLQLGRMQAESMRSNALGQRLAEMAGLDKSEFDFSVEPALGGSNTELSGNHLDIVDLKESIDRVAENLAQERLELDLLENAMLDKDLKQSLDPKGWPVKRGYISSSYGYRSDPFTGKKVFHKGVDIPSAEGSPIHALAAGVVTRAENRSGFGNMVEIDHGNGYLTRYAHISKLAVKTGDRIDQDQVIAEIGSTGRSTGPHLHLEMFKDGRRFNPRKRLYSARKAKDH